MSPNMPDEFPTPEWWPALAQIEAEVIRQKELWGDQHHLDGTGPNARFMNASVVLLADIIRERVDRIARETPEKEEWAGILLEELFEALSENDLEKLDNELTQLAAVVVSWKVDIQGRKHG